MDVEKTPGCADDAVPLYSECVDAACYVPAGCTAEVHDIHDDACE